MLTTVALVLSALLNLEGSESSIRFGAPNHGAILKASCEADEPSVKWVSPRTFDTPTAAGNVTVEFLNVKPTCVGSSINVPCAKHSDAHPDLFYFHFKGAKGSVVEGPVPAYPRSVYVDGAMVDIAVEATASLPSYDDVVRVTGYAGSGEPVSLNVSVTYYASEGEGAVMVPFRGVPDGSVISISGLPGPPSPPSPYPPPSPPNPPPAWDKCVAAGKNYYKLAARDLPYSSSQKTQGAQWYAALCKAIGKKPVGCSSNYANSGGYSVAFSVYQAGYGGSCNPSGWTKSQCGWERIITFHQPHSDSYGLCGDSCTISRGPSGWSPVCMD